MSTQKLLHGCLLAPLFIIAKTWEEPNCPSVDEWINSDAPIQWNIIQC